MARKSAKKITKKNPQWKELSHAQKVDVFKKMFRTYRRVSKFAAGCYNVVGKPSHTRLRDRAHVEFGGEDDALTTVLRNQFINLARNGIRNNETLNAIIHQFKVNVVGTVGGKAYFDFGPELENVAKVLHREFKKHCRSCEFFDGIKLKDFLEIVLETVALGGDMVVAFDNHTFEDSGKLIGYEPDCIADLDEGIFKRKFRHGETQRQGRIYTESSRFMGVTVSASERGKSAFAKEDDVHVFTKAAGSDPFDNDWIMLRNGWRLNQGRGTPPISGPLGSFLDVDILQSFEIEAAKLNSQQCAQVYQTGSDSADEDPTPSADLARTEFDEATVADIDAAAEEAAADDFEEQPPRFQELESAGVVWNLMPANSKMELLDTKHPNPNMNEFIRVVAGRGGWALGVASVYTNGKVDSSYTGYRGEQLMTWPTFERWQKWLEEFCDWHFRRWFAWASKFNPAVRAVAAKIDDDVLDEVKWTWPIMKEVNAVDAQNAWNAGLKNGTIGYADILGPDWKEKLTKRAAEREFCRSVNFPHPADQTVSGQLIGDISNDEAGNNPDNREKENKDE